ncbi:unnamed protein product [Peniophora sp. CBMAI 1063]|nr:unnamed protein product [Peniophora sp. CBMAI 1063]
MGAKISNLHSRKTSFDSPDLPWELLQRFQHLGEKPALRKVRVDDEELKRRVGSRHWPIYQILDRHPLLEGLKGYTQDSRVFVILMSSDPADLEYVNDWTKNEVCPTSPEVNLPARGYVEARAGDFIFARDAADGDAEHGFFDVFQGAVVGEHQFTDDMRQRFDALQAEVLGPREDRDPEKARKVGKPSGGFGPSYVGGTRLC